MGATKVFWVIETHANYEKPDCIVEPEHEVVRLISDRVFGTVLGVYECEVGGNCVDRTDDILSAAHRYSRDEAA